MSLKPEIQPTGNERVAEIVETAGYLCGLGARATVKSTVTLASQRTHLEDPHNALQLAMEIRKVKGQVAGRYEIEARELEYQKASATQGGRLTQLDGQGGIRGLIEDATRDTTLWLQADPSPEEQAHVLAMQGRLGRRGK